MWDSGPAISVSVPSFGLSDPPFFRVLRTEREQLPACADRGVTSCGLVSVLTGRALAEHWGRGESDEGHRIGARARVLVGI